MRTSGARVAGARRKAACRTSGSRTAAPESTSQQGRVGVECSLEVLTMLLQCNLHVRGMFLHHQGLMKLLLLTEPLKFTPEWFALPYFPKSNKPLNAGETRATIIYLPRLGPREPGPRVCSRVRQTSMACCSGTRSTPAPQPAAKTPAYLNAPQHVKTLLATSKRVRHGLMDSSKRSVCLDARRA